MRKNRQHTYNNGSSSTTAIKSLPKDLLVEVVASVASHSFTDLHNMKLCCKDLLDATKDNYVFQQVSLDKFPLIQWLPNEKESSFLKRCRESQNLESLYREGLRECLGNGNIDGLESLNMAAQKGHKEAKYVYGMILLCSQDEELIKQGLKHMHFLRKSRCVIRTRNKVEQLAQFMWINNRKLVANQKPLCPFKGTCKGWSVSPYGVIYIICSPNIIIKFLMPTYIIYSS